MSRYGRKIFSKHEWKQKISRDLLVTNEYVQNKNNGMISGTNDKSDEIEIENGFNRNENGFGWESEGPKNLIETGNKKELSIPKLLLNYFIINGYEESSIRMAKELNLLASNKDIQDFNTLFRINERNLIKRLIKSGKILAAIQEINLNFGLNALDMESNKSGNNKDNRENNSNDNDLYFKLYLLNLIEMIRSFNNNTDPHKDSKTFMLQIINYSKDKLAMKASKNPKNMEELQLAMSLLLLTTRTHKKQNTSENTSSVDKDFIKKLPTKIKYLYSLSLRTKIAEIVNRKLLNIINLNVANQNKFPNLILNNKFALTNNDNNRINHNLSFQYSSMGNDTVSSPKNDITEISIDKVSTAEQPLGTTVTSQNQYWRETKKYLNINYNYNFMNKDEWDSFNYIDNNSQFESRLIQLMKLWSWSENTLHHNDIGVPSIEDTFTQQD